MNVLALYNNNQTGRGYVMARKVSGVYVFTSGEFSWDKIDDLGVAPDVILSEPYDSIRIRDDVQSIKVRSGFSAMNPALRSFEKLEAQGLIVVSDRIKIARDLSEIIEDVLKNRKPVKKYAGVDINPFIYALHCANYIDGQLEKERILAQAKESSRAVSEKLSKRTNEIMMLGHRKMKLEKDNQIVRLIQLALENGASSEDVMKATEGADDSATD